MGLIAEKIMKKFFCDGSMKKFVNFFNENEKIPIKFEYENKVKFEPGRRMVLTANHSGWFALDGMVAGELIWDDLYKCYLESTGKDEERDGRKVFCAIVHDALVDSPVAKMFPPAMRKEAMIGRKEYIELLSKQDSENLPYYTGIFPESEIGSTKSFLQAYKLKEFKTGFIRNALITDADIIVTTITGNEELMPSLCSIKVENRSKGKKLIFPVPMFPLLLSPFTKGFTKGEMSYKLTVHEVVSIESIRERLDSGESLKEIAEWFRQKTQSYLDKETFHRPLSVASRYFDKFRKASSELLDFQVNFRF